MAKVLKEAHQVLVVSLLQPLVVGAIAGSHELVFLLSDVSDWWSRSRTHALNIRARQLVRESTYGLWAYEGRAAKSRKGETHVMHHAIAHARVDEYVCAVDEDNRVTEL